MASPLKNKIASQTTRAKAPKKKQIKSQPAKSLRKGSVLLNEPNQTFGRLIIISM